MKHTISKLHFVGIGGAGMSGIAELLHNLGYSVSGSDIQSSSVTQRLQELGMRICIGHKSENVKDAQVLVTSSAIDHSNPEVIIAQQKNIPIVPRALMLAELMRFKKGIAIAGTHGKTTTTSLVTSVLAQGGIDPTFVIGGKLNAAGVNAQLGSGEFLVAEADESDASFLKLLPVMEVVTNIDEDHMSTYDHSLQKLKQAFVDFAHNMPFYGQFIACIDDENVHDILPLISRPIVTYGMTEQAKYRAINVEAHGTQMHFTVLRPENRSLDIKLNLAGLHNVQNALAAIAIATELEVEDESIIIALANFKGVGRRFQSYTCKNNNGEEFTLIDDYGHHPVEMKATLQAVRGAYPNNRVILAFQPHRYTRTRDCFDDFVKVLSQADDIILTEVYSAGEQPINAVDGRALTRAVRSYGKVEPLFVDTIDELKEILQKIACKGDVVLSMGAGSIGGLPAKLYI
jgi:UDP-N-acetylmuramate--alanine ligase